MMLELFCEFVNSVFCVLGCHAGEWTKVMVHFCFEKRGGYAVNYFYG